MEQPGDSKRYRTFENLETYQAARELRKAMGGVAKRLPEQDKFGLAPQVRRAASSLINNIAEGHASRGSTEEFLDDLNSCEDEQYLPLAEVDQPRRQGWPVHRPIGGYIRYLRSRLDKNPSRANELPAIDYHADPAGELFNHSTIQPFKP